MSDSSTPETSSHPSTPHRPIRSYVLRQGHLSKAQERALTTLWPRYGLPFQPQALDLDTVFQRQAPRILEIGFGMGQATATIAHYHPEQDFLAVEVHTPGVGSLLNLLDAQHLSNVRIIQHDAVEVLSHMIAPNTLDGVHIFFPDPWHKKRHHKRRLIQTPFVNQLVSRLKTGGYLHVATDWEDYAEHILDVLQHCPNLHNTADTYAPKPSYRPQTKFEARGLRLGHGVWDLVFRKSA